MDYQLFVQNVYFTKKKNKMIEITYKKFWIIPTYEVYFGYNNKKTYKKFSIVEIINICDDLDLKWFKKKYSSYMNNKFKWKFRTNISIFF